MINQNHKYLLVGVLVGLLAYWVWAKRSGSGPSSEGG